MHPGDRSVAVPFCRNELDTGEQIVTGFSSITDFDSIPFAADPADRVPDEAVRGDAVALRDAAGAQLRGRHALARPQAPHPAQAPPPLTGEDL